jgi:dihydrodipicolinate synthase/N-acetylneuraminate lyase
MIAGTDIRGIIPPIVTPVTQDDSVDFDGLRRVVRHVLGGGVHGIFAMGGTGNFASFSAQERFEIARTVVQEVRRRVPVLVGSMDSNTRLVLRNVQLAAQAGADAVVVEPPFYYPCTLEDVLTHYRTVAESSPLPLIIYNQPSASKVHMNLSLITMLAALPKVIGMKDSSGDFTLFQEELSAFAGTGFRVLQGLEPLLGASFLLGAPGSIVMLANVLPRLCVQLFEAGSAGKLEETRKLQAQLMSAFAMFKDYRDDSTSNPYYGEVTQSAVLAGLECSLDTLGICKKVTMAPWQIPSPADHKRISEMVAHFG